MKKSGIYTFPAGEAVEALPLVGTPQAAAHGPYLMLRPFQNHAVGVLDLTSKQIFLANKQRAFDLYGDFFVSERVNGELGLYRTKSRELASKVVMPRNDLGTLRAAAVSSDLRWVAVSGRSRGAVWDLSKGERVVHTRGFRGAHLREGALFADFPRFEQTPRTVARFDLASREASEHKKLDGAVWVAQHGPVLVSYRPAKQGGNLRENVAVEVSDAAGAGVAAWSRDFPKQAPWVVVDEQEGALVFGWPARAEAVKSEIKNDPALTSRLAALREKQGDYFLQIVDARTGRPSGALFVETGKGSFHIRDVHVAGDRVVLQDSENRVLIYSMKTGAQLGRVFGGRPAVSRAGNLLCVENGRGRLTLYDLATAERRDEFTFAGPVSLARFSEDGRRLFVLTADQTAYVLDLSAKARSL